MKKKLLVIEDENSVAKQMSWGLGKDYDITFASNAEQAKILLASGMFPVVTLDLGLPPFPNTPQQGLELLEQIAHLSPYTKVVVITGNAEDTNAIKAIALGAADFYSKPIDLKILKIILSRTFKIHELEDANRRLQCRGNQSGSFCGIIGTSPVMHKVFDRLRQVSKTDYPVLITGKTGTGKELAAQAIHNLSQRAEKPLIIINCGAIPKNLLESELFGHEKGAFTGATDRQIGKFEQADGGTIFLDEIGELPLLLQVKILRVLQSSTIDRLGGRKTRHLNVRIFAATNVNLEEAVQQKTFREDLYYRLNVVPVEIPDLKERSEDILLLAHNFLLNESRLLKRGQLSFSHSALRDMAVYNWPGNVRELQNRIRRALSITIGSVITSSDMGLEELASEDNGQKLTTLKEARENAEKNAVHQALALSGHNISKTAKLLEISRPTLHDLIKKHDVNVRQN